VCHSYSDLNFGVTFLEHSVITEKDRTRLFTSAVSNGHELDGKVHKTLSPARRNSTIQLCAKVNV